MEKSNADAVAVLRYLDASKQLIKAAQEALENVQRKYDRGVVDILEMLSVQMALTDAELERVRSLSDWRSGTTSPVGQRGNGRHQGIRSQGTNRASLASHLHVIEPEQQ